MACLGQSFDDGLRRSLGFDHIIGVDEAGRGPLAGPVVVAAVLLGPRPARGLWAAKDSKLLTALQRERLFTAIRAEAQAVSVAWAHPRRIEQDNILRATLEAMGRCVLRVGKSGLVLVDGNRTIPRLGRRQLAIIDGDRMSLAVSCASIVAKVCRDRWMRRLDRRYPGYGLADHKGYGTQAHLRALRRLGPSPVHRRTFTPVEELLTRRS